MRYEGVSSWSCMKGRGKLQVERQITRQQEVKEAPTSTPPAIEVQFSTSSTYACKETL